MNRRDALKSASLILGYTITGAAATAILNGCKAETPEAVAAWAPKYMTEAQGKLVSTVVDLIIPKTDTPSATEVGVPGFMDIVFGEILSEEDRSKYQEGLAKIDALAQAAHQKNFVDLEVAQQVAMLEDLDKKAFTKGESIYKEGEERPLEVKWWRSTKGSAYSAYFTSEQIGTEVMPYAPVPGPYIGCVDLQETTGGKAWAF